MLAHVVSGEVASFEADECAQFLAFSEPGDDDEEPRRAYVVTTRRTVWANDLLKWSLWMAPSNRRRFFWSRDGGSVWEADWTSAGRSSGCTALEDVSTSVSESQWYHAAAADHRDDLLREVESFAGERDLDGLDLFSRSRSIEASFRQSGYRAAAFDIALSAEHDLTSERGVRQALQQVLRLREHGLIFAGPPCSLFVYMSSSVHCRTSRCLLGDTRNFRVRLSNLLVENLAVLLDIASSRSAWWVLEQPSSSWLLKQAAMVAVRRKHGASCVTTWMGAFDHPMLKCTHLCGTLPKLGLLARTRPEGRSSGSAAAARETSHGGAASVGQGYGRHAFYTKSGSSVTGGPDLHRSAVYTRAFAVAVVSAWEASQVALGRTDS